MIADIANGNTDSADIFFLVALIVFLVAGIVSIIQTSIPYLYSLLIAVGLASTALAFLLL